MNGEKVLPPVKYLRFLIQVVFNLFAGYSCLGKPAGRREWSMRHVPRRFFIPRKNQTGLQRHYVAAFIEVILSLRYRAKPVAYRNISPLVIPAG